MSYGNIHNIAHNSETKFIYHGWEIKLNIVDDEKLLLREYPWTFIDTELTHITQHNATLNTQK